MMGFLVALTVFLLIASAFFVGAEFALVAARRTVVEPLAVHSKRARTTLRAMEDVSLMMATAQLGITVCGVLLGALGEPAIAVLLEPAFSAMGVPVVALHAVSLAIALLLLTCLHVALGEMVPKNIALAGPERTALALAPLLMWLTRMLGPIVRWLNRFANFNVRLTGRKPRDEVSSVFSREEVAALVAQSTEEGLLDRNEGALISSALDFETSAVGSVLLADDRVVSLPLGASSAEVEQLCGSTGFSRFPVRDDAGRYIGYLHIRDIVGATGSDRDRPIPAEKLRTLPAMAISTDLRTALDRMRQAGAHMAQVVADPVSTGTPVKVPATAVPAPGRRRGLVMLEDVIEELVGDIADANRLR